MPYYVVNENGDMENIPTATRCMHNNGILPGTEHIYEMVRCEQCGYQRKQTRDLSTIKLTPWYGLSKDEFANRLTEINKEVEVRIFNQKDLQS